MYAATLDGPSLTFEVAGVWRRNLLIRDRQTGSIWQQATGEALAGPLRGARLEPITAEQTRWAAWRGQHPGTRLAVEPEASRHGPLAFWRHRLLPFLLHQATRHAALPGLAAHDPALPPLAEIAGISLGGEARAYPLDQLRRRGRVDDRLAGRDIAVFYEVSADRVRAFLCREGQPLESLPVTRVWWLGWSEFHPGTTVFAGPR